MNSNPQIANAFDTQIDTPSVHDREWQRGDEYVLSTCRARLDLDFVHDFLVNQSYWARHFTRDMLNRAVAGSLPFGVYDESQGGRQVGFARLVTDYAVFAYLRDVFVMPEHQRKGLARWIAQAAFEHPSLLTVENWMLSTRDAHAVYARVGYAPLEHPEWIMQRRRSASQTPPLADSDTQTE